MAFTRVVGPGIHTQANIDSHNINSTGIITAVSFVGDGSGLTGINTDFIVGTAITMGTANFTGNVTIGGTLTYEDVKNIDSVGIVTARTGIKVLAGGANIVGVLTSSDGIFIPDNKKLEIGNQVGSGDLKLYHNTSDYIQSSSQYFYIGGENVMLTNAAANEITLKAIQNGAVQLYYDNVKKSETTAKGIKVGTGVTIETNGQATYTGIITATAFKLADGSAIGAGAGGTWSTYTAGIATSKSVGVNTSNLDDNDLVGVGNSFQGLYISNGMMITDNKLSGNHYIGTAFNGLMAGPVNIEGTLTIDGNYVVV